jgi:hypothetical protein
MCATIATPHSLANIEIAAFLMSHRDWQRDKKQELRLIGTHVEKFPKSRDVALI